MNPLNLKDSHSRQMIKLVRIVLACGVFIIAILFMRKLHWAVEVHRPARGNAAILRFQIEQLEQARATFTHQYRSSSNDLIRFSDLVPYLNTRSSHLRKLVDDEGVDIYGHPILIGTNDLREGGTASGVIRANTKTLDMLAERGVKWTGHAGEPLLTP